jgi:hypothetical protein
MAATIDVLESLLCLSDSKQIVKVQAGKFKFLLFNKFFGCSFRFLNSIESNGWPFSSLNQCF